MPVVDDIGPSYVSFSLDTDEDGEGGGGSGAVPEDWRLQTGMARHGSTWAQQSGGSPHSGSQCMARNRDSPAIYFVVFTIRKISMAWLLADKFI